MHKTSSLRRAAAGVAALAGAAGIAAMQFVATPASALTALQNLNAAMGATASSAGITTTQSLPQLIGSFISAALGLLGVVLVVLVIYAGFLWMTAAGNEEKIKKAKGMITSAVIGMIIIFAAYAITSFVIASLTTAVTAS